MRAVFELDDLSDRNDPYDKLLAVKQVRPDLKATLFAVPMLCSDALLEKYGELSWVQLALHGYHHSSYECAVWTKGEAVAKIQEGLDRGCFVKGFKAPGWVAHQEVYKALAELELWSADHAEHIQNWKTSPLHRYVYNSPPFGVVPIHGHTWETCGNGPEWWGPTVTNLPEGVSFEFVSEVVALDDVDVIQEDRNSWSHKSAFGARAVAHLMEAMGYLKPTGKVLDIGGNDGTAAFMVHKDLGCDVSVLDLSHARVAFARERYKVNAQQGHSENMPFVDREFEWGFCAHTLEHVDDLEKTLGEIRRVCSRGCWVVVPVEDEAKCREDMGHKRFGTYEWWLVKLGAREIRRTEEELVCLIEF